MGGRDGLVPRIAQRVLLESLKRIPSKSYAINDSGQNPNFPTCRPFCRLNERCQQCFNTLMDIDRSNRS